MDIEPIIDAHELWVRSQGKEGSKAQLENADLSFIELKDRNLSQA
jgi:hypothetical protein